MKISTKTTLSLDELELLFYNAELG